MEQRENELTGLYKNLMKEKSRSCEDAFFKKLVETQLWVPGVPHESDKEKKALALLVTGEGKKFIPAFLDKDGEIGRFPRDQLVPMTYSRLKYWIIDSREPISGMVLNPFGENILLDRGAMELVDARTMGMTLKREEHQTKVRLRTPELVPKGLIEDLGSFLQQEIQVDSAWLLLAKQENQEQEYWMLMMDFHGKKIELFPKVAERMQRYMRPGDIFELIGRDRDINIEQIRDALIYSREYIKM